MESDAKGYYAYLPAVFVYEDLHFGFFDEIEKRNTVMLQMSTTTEKTMRAF